MAEEREITGFTYTERKDGEVTISLGDTRPKPKRTRVYVKVRGKNEYKLNPRLPENLRRSLDDATGTS